MKPIQIISTKCKVCGKPIASASRSVLGMDAEKKAFGDVCSNCATESEVARIVNAQGDFLKSGLGA